MDHSTSRGDDRHAHRPDAAAGRAGATAAAGTRALVEDPGTDALAGLEAVADRSRQREQSAAEKEAAATRAALRAKRTRSAAFAILLASLLFAIAGFAVSIVSSGTRAEDVAATLAEPVAERVLADGRSETAKGARGELDAANDRLMRRNLPIVPQPPPDAPSYRIQIQAARAYVLADLPEPIAEQLREAARDSRTPGVLPSMLTIPIPDLSAGIVSGDSIVTTLAPSGEGGARSGGPSGSSGATSPRGSGTSSGSSGDAPGSAAPTVRAPAPPVAPAPAPPTSSRRGLFPLLPLPDLPLIGRLPVVGR